MNSAGGDGEDGCQGDSGGPLYDAENKVLVGVTSWGAGCANDYYPGVWARISSQSTWIKNVMCAWSRWPTPFCELCTNYDNPSTPSAPPSTTVLTSGTPSATPSHSPSEYPTGTPSATPSTTLFTSGTPSATPSTTLLTSGTPSATPSYSPSEYPTNTTSALPTFSPSNYQTGSPSTIPITSNFNITLINAGSSTKYDDAFEAARTRWESIFVEKLYSFPKQADGFDWFYGLLSKGYNDLVDDIVIGYEIGYIDGPGQVLGAAGKLYTRYDGSTISGRMNFEEMDLDNMAADDAAIVILHEMGHVLGLSGLDDAGICSNNNCANSNFNYGCTEAQNEYANLFPGKQLRLENDGGPGTECAHWEEDDFSDSDSSELMTGTFEQNKCQPISRVTIAGLKDISSAYKVDLAQADPYPYPCGSRSATDTEWKVYAPTKTFSLKGKIKRDFNPIVI